MLRSLRATPLDSISTKTPKCLQLTPLGLARRLSPISAMGLSLALALLVAGPLTAQDVVWRQSAEPIHDLREMSESRGAEPASLPSLASKAAEPSNVLILPSYLVDSTSASGETTLFAVRNTGGSTQNVTIEYLNRLLVPLRTDMVNIAPRALTTINLRDIPQVIAAAEGDGFSRGIVRITAPQSVIEGDYFQVNPGQNFATGNRLAEQSDFCELWGIRFLNGGAFTGGTDYRFLINTPQGGDPNNDDPSLIVNVYSEAGTLLTTWFAYTNLHVVETDAANIVGNLATSGSMEVLVNSAGETGGLTSGNFSATGRFSVGVDAVCLDSAL